MLQLSWMLIASESRGKAFEKSLAKLGNISPTYGGKSKKTWRKDSANGERDTHFRHIRLARQIEKPPRVAGGKRNIAIRGGRRCIIRQVTPTGWGRKRKSRLDGIETVQSAKPFHPLSLVEKENPA